MPEWPPPALAGGGLTFHHVGYATRALARDREALAGLGYQPEGPPFVASEQGVRAQFLMGGGLRIELLEPLPGATVLDPWLRFGGGLCHLAYVAQDLERAIAHASEYHGKLLRSPWCSPALGDRAVVFVMLPTGLLVELIAG